MKVKLLAVTAVLGYVTALGAPPALAQDKLINLALGKAATFDPAPNYSFLFDPNNRWELTDGKYSSQGHLVTVDQTDAIWVQKGTVGWTRKDPIISLDLGQVQPISGAMFSTAAGRAGVEFPSCIFVGVSDDDHTWHNAGDLIALSNKIKRPPAAGYTTWRFVTHGLHAHGRYVAFSVIGQPYVFCDEIELYRGADAWVNEPATGPQFTNMRQFTRSNVARTDIARRLNSDLKSVRAELAASALPAPRRQALADRLDALAPQCDVNAIVAPDPATFRAIVPINDTDAQILAVHGAILAATNPRLVVWHQHRYQWLPLLAVPPQNPATPVLDIAMMKNEYRSDALLLTNAGTTALAATVKIVGTSPLSAPVLTVNALPSPIRYPQSAISNLQSAITVSAVPFVDTAAGMPVAAALPTIEAGPDGYAFSLPAGLTTKLWITVDSRHLAPGSYPATLAVRAGETQRSMPFEVRVSRITMATPRLSLGMWDNSDAPAYGITWENMPQAIALMRSHLVDTTWANPGALPSPHAADFDADNNLKAPLNWKSFDAWVARWPGARNYFIFASVRDVFAGAALGTPGFDARVGAWAREFYRGLQERKMDTSHVAILLVDEPNHDAQANTIAAWEHAIKAAAPEITIFEDPTWARPDQVGDQDQAALTQPNILSPNLSVYSRGGAAVVDYFAARQAAGQKLWFYQCSGPARQFDPTTYYRLQAWHAFLHGALGVEFWAFGDTGGSPSSWDEYLNQHNAYTPVFLDGNSVTNGIQWDAVREGVEDYEYLAMLRDRIATAANGDWKRQASRLLSEVQASITDDPAQAYTWKADSAVELPDEYRLKALALLETAN